MGIVVKFFEPAVPPKSLQKSKNKNENENTNDDGIIAWNGGIFDNGANGSLYMKLHYLQHKLLKNFDITLYTHLEFLGLPPQLYMMRWIRTLFSREFYLDQTIKLWDNLFLSKDILEFIDYIVVAMVHHVREFLLQKQDMSAIKILQNFPKSEINMVSLTDIARKIQNGIIKNNLSDSKYVYVCVKIPLFIHVL